MLSLVHHFDTHHVYYAVVLCAQTTTVLKPLNSDCDDYSRARVLCALANRNTVDVNAPLCMLANSLPRPFECVAIDGGSLPRGNASVVASAFRSQYSLLCRVHASVQRLCYQAGLGWPAALYRGQLQSLLTGMFTSTTQYIAEQPVSLFNLSNIESVVSLQCQ